MSFSTDHIGANALRNRGRSGKEREKEGERKREVTWVREEE